MKYLDPVNIISEYQRRIQDFPARVNYCLTNFSRKPHENEKIDREGRRASPPPEILFYSCCDMGQNDTIGKIELNPSFVLSSDNTNCKNDIQLFPQLFDELRVNGDYH